MIEPEPVEKNSQQHRPSFSLKLALLYLGCGLLVTCYVNTFQLWAWLVRQIGPCSRYLPIVVVSVVFLAVVVYLIFKYRTRGIDYRFLAAGLGACLAALAIPDPQIPIKRIHVAEYLLLAFFVRYTLSQRLTGWHLTLFTSLVTALFGIHDELFQGLHPQRYYGLPDMSVNCLAGLGGTLLGHAARLFAPLSIEDSLPAHDPHREREEIFRQRLPWMAGLLAAGVLFLVVTLSWYKEGFIPWWTMLPLLGAVLAWQGTGFCSRSPQRVRHGLQAVCWLSLLLLLYPTLANVTPLAFK